jgi:hypothetical protein
VQRLPLLVILCIAAGLIAWNVGHYAPDPLAAERAAERVLLQAPATEEARAGMALAMGIGAQGTLDHPLEGAAASQGAAADAARSAADCPEDLQLLSDEEGQEQDVPLLHDDGSLQADVHTKDGLLDGPWVEYTPDGEKLTEGEFIEGARAGHWVFWRPDGSKRAEGSYLTGVKQGAWTSWHENGLPEREVFYEAGDQDGMYREWYTNGQVRAAGLFILGRREGFWEFYDFEGGIDVRTGTYVNGKRVR